MVAPGLLQRAHARTERADAGLPLAVVLVQVVGEAAEFLRIDDRLGHGMLRKGAGRVYPGDGTFPLPWTRLPRLGPFWAGTGSRRRTAGGSRSRTRRPVPR
ncbi:MAG: hypothetical protein ACK559_17975, partial [bacterium]